MPTVCSSQLRTESSRRGATARAGISAPPDRAKRRSVCKALRQEPLRDVCFLLASMFLADVKGWNRLSGRNNGRLCEIFNGPAAGSAAAGRIIDAGVRQANAHVAYIGLTL
ncbi:hypothetical protein [Burkholderia sp. BCC0419]|uniref:hypothetical protein n=1 Tax=Burkholderia sp. BCC0419 TaxID=486878 RepID=UPI001ABBB9E7|nr:hypothetical protein [Burkholderia sp. BCC0419]